MNYLIIAYIITGVVGIIGYLIIVKGINNNRKKLL